MAGGGDFTVKRLDEMEAVFHGAFRLVGAELEVASFGLNVFEMPPDGGERYPDHTHAEDGQEEVYVVLGGSGRIEIDGEVIEVDPQTIVRCGPSVRRKIRAGPDGLRMLVIGGVPGAGYTRPEMFSKPS